MHPAEQRHCRILEGWGLSGSEVPLEEVLHLKTGVNYLEDGNISARVGDDGAAAGDDRRVLHEAGVRVGLQGCRWRRCCT